MEDSKIKSVCDRIFYMAKKRKSFESILKDLDLKDYELMGLIQLMHQEGYNIDYINGELIIRNKPVKHDDVYQVPNNLDHLKLLLIKLTKKAFNIFYILEISQMAALTEQSKYMNYVNLLMKDKLNIV